jgi:tetratricopeptide (TPR) repeat protein
MSKKSLGGFNIYVILGLLFIAVVGLRTISTPEIWTHLALGQSGGPISFLESDSFVNTTWLYDKLAYFVWNIGKAPLLIILNIIGLLTAFGLLLQVAKKWGGGLSQSLALLLCGHLIFQSLDVGPQVMMMVFIALFVYGVTEIKNQGLLLGILIPAQILWTNMHGSFLFGPLIALLAFIQASQSSGQKRTRKQSSAGMYGILTGAVLVATFANPYLFKMHAQVIANIQSPAPVYWSSLFVDYFQIPALKPLIFFIVVLGAAGLITLKKKLPIVLTTLAVIGAFLIWTSPKNAMLFTVLAFPFIVLSLTSVSEYLHASLSTVLGKNEKMLPVVTGSIISILLIVSMIPMVTSCEYVKTGSASKFGLGIQDNLYPNDCEALFNHPAFPKTCLNLAADGGYLAFNYNRQCFIDYRPGTYNKEVLKNLELMLLGNKNAYDELYEKYRPEAIVINTLLPYSANGLNVLLNKGIWKLAYFDGTSAILIQDKPQFAELIENTGMQKAGLAKLEAVRAAYAEKDGSCSLGNPAELIGGGKVYLALNRPEKAKAIFSLLLRGNGSIPAAWIGLGASQLQLKEFEDSMASLKIAISKAPENELAWREYARACQLSGNTEEYEKAIEKLKELAAKREKETKQEEEEEDTPAPVETKSTSLQDITVD